ncbi:expressed unknown protein [Seminavis robusta]|uniref:Uncharacterized protein n=1 Tax=Seminavis robusta TaxID=568900 RepID=A0A9N8DY19_9STRA|nr:expressed unknown protein [Seminavis robusta]|eukprot:Sro458_g147040.1 n/a (311) ;mRNA; f:18642-19574
MPSHHLVLPWLRRSTIPRTTRATRSFSASRSTLLRAAQASCLQGQPTVSKLQPKSPYQSFPSTFGGYHSIIRRGLVTDTSDKDNHENDDTPKPQIVLQKLGDFPYGSREYKLVLQRQDSTHPVATLRAHRNMIFGAQLLGEIVAEKKKSLSEVCLPLLDVALEDASKEAEQPQAMATLHGLCDWVAAQCHDDDDNDDEAVSSSSDNKNASEILHQLKIQSNDELLAYHAVRAIATGIPRPGHSVVGQGTFRDGQAAWEALANEFIDKKLADEVELYKTRGATVVAIEHLADTKPDYLKSAGGAMARLFFL